MIEEFEDDRTWLEAESLWLGQMRDAGSYVDLLHRQAKYDVATKTRAEIDARLAVWDARGRPNGIDRLCADHGIETSERWILRIVAAVRAQRDLVVQPFFADNPPSVQELAEFVGGPFTIASGDLLKHLRPGAALVARRWVRTFVDEIGDIAVEISDTAFGIIVGAPIPLATPICSTVRDRLGAWRTEQEAQRRPTGASILDDAFGGGLAPGELVVLAGNPGMGKTSLALGLSWRMATQGQATVFFSNEDHIDRLARRLASLILPGAGDSTDSRWDPQWARMANLMAESHFAVEATGMTAAGVADRCEAINAERAPIAVVVVDSLWCLERSARACPLRTLKHLAVELQVPVIVTARVRATVETRADKRPRPVDLLLPGPDFEAVDVFVCLYRDGEYGPDSVPSSSLEIAAHRRRGVRRVFTAIDEATGRIGPPEDWDFVLACGGASK